LLGKNIGIDLTTGASFWQEWAELLVRWSGEEAKSLALKHNKE
jgi:hypothetical protein